MGCSCCDTCPSLMERYDCLIWRKHFMFVALNVNPVIILQLTQKI